MHPHNGSPAASVVDRIDSDPAAQMGPDSTFQPRASQWIPPAPLRLRPHNLLCLQGWQGMGYSPEFTANMDRVAAHLAADPEAEVALDAGLDSLCGACPLSDGAACYHDRAEGGRIADHDARTLARLGLTTGRAYRWRELEAAVARAFAGADIATHCAFCRWQPLGVCAAGIDALRLRVSPMREELDLS